MLDDKNVLPTALFLYAHSKRQALKSFSKLFFLTAQKINPDSS